jgi:hypothetical protein
VTSSDGGVRHSDRWKCRHCGGRLELVDHGHTDASGWEAFECACCAASGEVNWFEGPDSPRRSGAVVPNSDEYGHTTPQSEDGDRS